MEWTHGVRRQGSDRRCLGWRVEEQNGNGFGRTQESSRCNVIMDSKKRHGSGNRCVGVWERRPCMGRRDSSAGGRRVGRVPRGSPRPYTCPHIPACDIAVIITDDLLKWRLESGKPPQNTKICFLLWLYHNLQVLWMLPCMSHLLYFYSYLIVRFFHTTTSRKPSDFFSPRTILYHIRTILRNLFRNNKFIIFPVFKK